MKLFVLSDLHLSGAQPKPMDIFGSAWENHAERIRASWQSSVSDADVVLVAGDISWAMTLDEALPDLRFMGDLPGRKVVIKGNHDYWWQSISRVRERGPSSVSFIQNDIVESEQWVISGTRLWNYPFAQWNGSVDTSPVPGPVRPAERGADDETMRRRELERVRLCLRQMPKEDGRLRVFLTHFPPLGSDFSPTLITQLLSEAGIQVCVFGHLHAIPKGTVADRTVDGVRYVLSSCDYLDFRPRLLYELPEPRPLCEG